MASALQLNFWQCAQLDKRGGKTHPDHLRAHLGDGFVLSQRHVRYQRRVADDAGVRVAVHICFPLPARGVGVAGADVFDLQTLELLLGTEFVRLCVCAHATFSTSEVQIKKIKK